MRGVFVLALLPLVLASPLSPISPPSSTETLVVVTDTVPTTETNEGTTLRELGKVASPVIKEMDIMSNVTNRFSSTLVKSKVKNEAPIAQEVTFFIVLPDQAFISGFIMEIGGKNYTAYVDEKEKAKQTYDDAVLSGIGAAHVAVSARDSNKFTVSVNVEPESKAVFYLNYEELLDRKDGRYELVLNIHPNQLVKHMNVQVDIMESRPITSIKTPPLRSGNEIIKENPKLDPKATIEHPTPETARVTFKPDYNQQKEIAQGLGKEENEGIGGQFVVQYDVERDPQGGEVLVKDGYFVHFFAPSDLKPLDKHVVFVLDTSGSMYDRKMNQLKTAMHNILGELNPKDLFNLVEFNTNVKVWNLDAPTESTLFPSSEDSWYSGDKIFDLSDVSFPPAYPVNNNTIKKANKYVDQMFATGGTNIYEALRVGLHLVKLRQTRTGDKNAQPLIVFLTDGDPTVGKTSPTDIISQIQEQNLAKVPIISLSFGTGADRSFLQKLSLRNTGFARHIYEDSDASLQLENFYKEISSPLLHNIKFVYTPDVTSLTRTEFPILYGGAEIVVCGTFPGNEFNKEASKVVSWGRNGPIDLLPSVQRATGQLERLWAYMTIKRYLDAKDVAVGNTTEYEKKALDLAKKYSFVTPVTSLVVVKPNATSKPVETEAADQANFPVSQYALQSFPAVGHRSFILPLSVNAMQPQYSLSGVPAPAMFYPGPMSTKTAGGGFGGGAVGFGGGYASAGPAPPFNQHVDSHPIAEEDADIRVLIAAESSTITISTTTQEAVTLPPEHAQKLPWLQEKMNPDGTLNFLKGKYQLGFNETSPLDEDCTDPKSEEGLCVLLKDCEALYPQLTSTQTFKDYFCIIGDNLAGVCCSKKYRSMEKAPEP